MNILTPRYEEKFSLTPEQLKFALNYARLKILRSYQVTNEYYDTSDLSTYWSAYNGDYTRKKLRLRSYSRSQNIIYSEVKHKVGKVTYKSRTKLPPDISNLKFHHHKKFLTHTLPFKDIFPVIKIQYNRLILKDEPHERITLDSNINYVFLRNGTHQKFFLTGTILEAKFFKTMSTEMLFLLNFLNIKRTKSSKYALCIEDFYQGEPV